MGGEVIEASSPAPRNCTERFEIEFPKYLAIGMSYEQFWEKDCCMVKFYRRAQKIRDERMDEEAWLQGLYFYSALCNASPLFRAFTKGTVKATPYQSEPFTTSLKKSKSKAAIEQKKRNGIEYMIMFAERFNKSRRKSEKTSDREVKSNERS